MSNIYPAPTEFGLQSAFSSDGACSLYNRFIRWSRLGVFDRIFAALAGEGPKRERVMIDSTHLKAHRTAASLLKKGFFPAATVKKLQHFCAVVARYPQRH